MSVIEEISRMSKSGSENKGLLEYICENYDKLNLNLMEMNIRSPKSTIVIFALTATLE